mmetsp:Transcript_29045/g.55746  ORF Transcript_29045/g.55746 Transcript_29045/m.55746 type:complete len:220 (-) Transcript_29045:240-899(-)
MISFIDFYVLVELQNDPVSSHTRDGHGNRRTGKLLPPATLNCIPILCFLIHLQRVIMYSKPKPARLSNLKHLLHHTPNTNLGRLVRSRLRPDVDAILLVADVNNATAYLVRILELFTDRAQQQIQPILVQQFFANRLGEHYCPLAAVLVGCVLPLRFNAYLEQREVGSRHQVTRSGYVVIQAPEVLDSIECVNGTQGSAPSCLLLATGRIVEPHGPTVL